MVRSVDELLNSRITSQASALGRIDAELNEMIGVEALLNEPSDGGLGALMDDIFNSLSSLSANPADVVNRTGAVQATDSLIDRFRQIAGELDQLQSDAQTKACLLYTSPSPRDRTRSRMPSSA